MGDARAAETGDSSSDVSGDEYSSDESEDEYFKAANEFAAKLEARAAAKRRLSPCLHRHDDEAGLVAALEEKKRREAEADRVAALEAKALLDRVALLGRVAALEEKKRSRGEETPQETPPCSRGEETPWCCGRSCGRSRGEGAS